MEHSSDEEEEEEDLDEVIAENLMENPGNSFSSDWKTAIASVRMVERRRAGHRGLGSGAQ